MSGFSWSFSRLKNFETCAKRHLHYDILKDIVEEESGALREGHDMHKAFEQRVRDGKALPLPYARHEKTLQHIIDADGETHTELRLALTRDFQATGFFAPDVWFRTVLDLAKVRSGIDAVIVDYKSGKPTEDETQLELMAATMFLYAQVEEVRAAYWFANHGKMVSRVFKQDDMAAVWAKILPRVAKLEAAVTENEFPPKPSGLCMRYCGVTSCPHHGVGSRW